MNKEQQKKHIIDMMEKDQELGLYEESKDPLCDCERPDYFCDCLLYDEKIKEEPKTSEEWQKQFPSTKVLDPDGWDRKNYQYSWFEEKITLAEYTTRLSRSTVYGIIPKEEQKQHLIDMMEKDEELGLYDQEIKLEDIFNYEKRRGVKDLIDAHKQDDENYLDSFGVTKTQFEVYRNFNKQETLEEAVNAFKKTDVYINEIKQKQERMYSEEDLFKILLDFVAFPHDHMEPRGSIIERYLKELKNK